MSLRATCSCCSAQHLLPIGEVPEGKTLEYRCPKCDAVNQVRATLTRPPEPPAGSSPLTPQTSGRFSLEANIIGLVGGGLLMIGPFMPWAKLGIFTASGLDKTGDEALLLCLLGVASIVTSGLSFLRKKDTALWLGFVTGGLGGLASFYYLGLIDQQVQSLRSYLFTPQIGLGLYVALGGSALLLIAALTGVLARRSRSWVKGVALPIAAVATVYFAGYGVVKAITDVDQLASGSAGWGASTAEEAIDISVEQRGVRDLGTMCAVTFEIRSSQFVRSASPELYAFDAKGEVLDRSVEFVSNIRPDEARLVDFTLLHTRCQEIASYRMQW